MYSLLEDVLLRTGQRHGFRKRLFALLDGDRSLGELRKTSRVVRDLVDQEPERVFRKLYLLSVDLDNPANLECLKRPAPFCHTLTITIGGEQPDDSPPQTNTVGETIKDMRARRPQSKYSVASNMPPPGLPPSPRTSAWQRRAAARQSYTAKGMAQHSQMRIPSSASILSIDSTSPPASSAYSLAQIPSAAPPTRPVSPTTSILNLYTNRGPLTLPYAKQRTALTSAYLSLLPHFLNLHTLRLRLRTANPAWPGLTNSETDLTALRTALETLPNPPIYLHKLILSPVHAAGVLHMRWHGFSAFGSAPATAQAFWKRITTLELHVRNPYTANRVTERQSEMFAKVLRDYLSSFAPTLQCLRFLWLESEGPDPFLLSTPTSSASNSFNNSTTTITPATAPTTPEHLHFPKLEELWLGSLKTPYKTLQTLYPAHTPNLQSVKILRSTHRGSLTGLTAVEAAEAWVEVLLGDLSPRAASGGVVLGQGSRGAVGARGKSSVYSFYEYEGYTPIGGERGSEDVGARVAGAREGGGGVSRGSREVGLLLDL